MSYRAEVYSIFIASPSDVETERKIVRDTIHEWNMINSNNKGVVLLPLGWETHSVPDMSRHAQIIINEQILKKADVLVGIFWSKVGTPTKDYPSGTIEEIQEHINAGKPTMVYFSKVALPQNFDPAQWNEVKRFKDFCKKKGLYCEYNSIDDFEKLFRNHLSIKINGYSSINNTADSDEIEFPDNVIDSLHDSKKYLLLFHDAINHAKQHKINEISAKLTGTFRKIYLYKELYGQTIMPSSHKDVFDELVESYNDYVTTVQSIIPLLNANRNSKEFEETQNNINIKQRKLLDLCNSAWKLFTGGLGGAKLRKNGGLPKT